MLTRLTVWKSDWSAGAEGGGVPVLRFESGYEIGVGGSEMAQDK